MRPLRPSWFLLSVCTGAGSFAQTSPDEASRQELLQQAEAARTGNDHTRALDLLERASRIRATPSVQLAMAQEQFALGHRVDAYANALACERVARTDGSLRNREGLLASCGALARELDAQLGRVVLRPAEGAPASMRLRVAGREIASALWVVPVVVEPGEIEVEAAAPGHEITRQRVTVAAGQRVEVSVVLRRVRAASTGAGPGPWITGGAGVASLVAAGVFYGLATGARDDRNASCMYPGATCEPIAQDHHDRFTTWRAAYYATLATGGALLGASVIWYLVARRPSEHRALTLHGGVSPDGAALYATARF
jgi:hypothetical protein